MHVRNNLPASDNISDDYIVTNPLDSKPILKMYFRRGQLSLGFLQAKVFRETFVAKKNARQMFLIIAFTKRKEKS